MTVTRKRSTRLWRYEVTEVWGTMQDHSQVKVGAVLIDHWKPDRDWKLLDVRTGKWVGGWRAKLLGEVTGDAYDRVMAS